MKTLAEIKMSPEDYAKGVKLSGKRATDLLKHSWAQHDASKDKQKAGDTEGASNALKVSGRAHKLYLKAKERHLKDPANAENHAKAMMSGASDYYKKAKPGQYVGDSIEVTHDGEQIDELSKTTLGSYVKKAVKDATINRKIATDFEHRANRAKKTDMKDASNHIADQFKSKSWRRQDNVNKAVDRLVKEAVSQIDEVSKSEVDHHYDQWTTSEYAPYNSDAGDDKKVHQSALSYLKSTNVPKEKHEKLAMHIADKFHGSGIDEAKDAREYDYEGDMAKSQLRSIISNAQTIHDMLKDDTNMAEWVQNKITLSADYISTVRDYMSSETNEENTMDKVHPDALHVKPATVNGQTKYKVHAVGKNFSDGIKVGEHLSDTELDDFSEMGGKVKHMKEERTLKDIIDEARGRPRKNPIAAPAKKSGDDEGEDYGPDSGPEADQHIQNQLKRAHDARDVEGGMKGGADVKFENGKKHFIKSEHAHKVLTALEKLKPADRAEAASHVYKSHENFQAVHSMLK